MREIKFRGQRIKGIHSGSFVYGFYIGGNDNQKAWIMPNSAKWLDGSEFIEVDPETVGQWTGLKDKNGKDIFEGDLIRVFAKGTTEDYHDSIEVIYSDRWAEFKCVAAQSLSHYIQLYYEFEIIGNIHETKKS